MAVCRIGLVDGWLQSDVTLKSGEETEHSVRQFPFNATDAMSLIGGRESEIKKPVRTAPRKKAAPKKQQ